MLGGENDRVADEAVPVAFDFGNFASLEFGAAIVVDDTDSTAQLKIKPIFTGSVSFSEYWLLT